MRAFGIVRHIRCRDQGKACFRHGVSKSCGTESATVHGNVWSGVTSGRLEGRANAGEQFRKFSVRHAALGSEGAK
jgi:hypothetical protein